VIKEPVMNSRRICSEEDEDHFRMIRAVLITVLVSSGVATGTFFYYLIGMALSNAEGIPLWQLDSTTPPFIGIICVLVFMISWIALHHVTRLKSNLC
jgi:hypothetical protein